MNARIIITFGIVVALAACRSQKALQVAQEESKDNSETSLDWAGTYRGLLPCADCEGIKTELKLNDNRSYELATLYVGKSEKVFTEKGSFKWDASGSTIGLESQKGKSEINKYQVGENQLFKLDKDGKRIQGDRANAFKGLGLFL
jgi:copper homeostasis protein (lipoprotein)